MSRDLPPWLGHGEYRESGCAEGKKRLYLLAGFRAVGKTTLLIGGLQQGFCPFGDEYLADFQKLHLPENPQSTPRYQEAKAAGSWFDMSNIYDLAHDKSLDHSVWIHLDLISLLYCSGSAIDDPSITTPLLPRTMETAYSPQQISHSLIRYFSHPFFKGFDELVVNMLFASWDVCKKQWLARTAGKQADLDIFERYIFEEAGVGESVHRAAYDGFATAMLYLKPNRLIQSQIIDNRLVLKNL